MHTTWKPITNFLIYIKLHWEFLSSLYFGICHHRCFCIFWKNTNLKKKTTTYWHIQIKTVSSTTTHNKQINKQTNIFREKERLLNIILIKTKVQTKYHSKKTPKFKQLLFLYDRNSSIYKRRKEIPSCRI